MTWVAILLYLCACVCVFFGVCLGGFFLTFDVVFLSFFLSFLLEACTLFCVCEKLPKYSIVTGKTQIACWTSCVNWDDKCLLLQVQLFKF